MNIIHNQYICNYVLLSLFFAHSYTDNYEFCGKTYLSYDDLVKDALRM